MTKILAIETATPACSVAVYNEGEVTERMRVERNRHGEILIPMVHDILRVNRLVLGDLDAIAFGSGPGSFTGLRIGVAVAQGLAYGAGLTMIPVSSLHALAERVRANQVLAAIDARMDQVYWGIYQQDKKSQRMKLLGDIRVDTPENVVIGESISWLAVGSGCDQYTKRLTESLNDKRLEFIPDAYPHAADIARIAVHEFEISGGIAPRLATPEYIRNEVATKVK